MFELGLPLHPMIVHFPIALFIVAFFLQILALIFKEERLSQTAWHCFLLGTAATPLVVWSGLEEAEEWRLATHQVFLLHKNLAFTTLFSSLCSFAILLIIKKKSARLFQVCFPVCLCAIVSAVILTAHYGGRLVYEYGIGMEDHS